jgi:RNA polymerase sigma-70 factor (ECF subfamily)
LAQNEEWGRDVAGEGVPTELTDEQLAVRAQQDPGAFAPLYRRYVTPIYAFCFQRLGTRELAEDATSQTFVKALAALPGYHAGSFRAWLYAIARHVVIDLQRVRPVVTLDDTPPVAGADLEAEVLRRASELDVRRLLAQLTPDQREVVELRLSGLNGPEIAEALGRSPGSVRALQFRAYQQLRSLLTTEEVTT